ncbi:hypothetical protein AB6A40_004410 [Gnathostoma spinigerum]|uniref:Glucosylceramidase n=1 Tax=Gnathostoma spinigerum TaxID=75299 RepID=A0ABD6EEQ8_9BILA
MTTDTGRVFENILFLLLGATAVIIILQNAYDREWKDGQSRRNLPDKIRRVPDHRECERKIINGDPSRIVCVCNASYCDDFPKLNLSSDEPIAVVYKTSKSGLRFQRTTAKITDKNSSKKGLRMKVNAGETFQTMIGFGGAFTDAAGINLDHLSPKSRANLMRSYFGDDGIQYSLGRVPIASCDFSTREYSYDDVENDFELKHFSLAEEDYKFKIPYILNAVNLTHGAINLFASPWSSPGWMKTNGRMKGGGKLIGKVGGKYYKSWANYFVKFLDQYAVNGVKFWGLTVQNEPTTGSDLKWPWQTLFFDDALQRDFIKSDLGPALKASKLGRNISLMIYDDNRPAAKSWAYTIFGDKNASDYVAGLAVHWYLDSASSPDAYSEIHKVYPDKFILATEACSGAQPWDKGVILGSWNRGMDYALNIFDVSCNVVMVAHFPMILLLSFLNSYRMISSLDLSSYILSHLGYK